MPKFMNATKVITGVNTRWSYANVWDPKSINGGAPKYSVSLIIPKTDLYSIYQAPLHTMSITPLPVLYNIALLKILTFPIFYAPTDIFFC